MSLTVIPSAAGVLLRMHKKKPMQPEELRKSGEILALRKSPELNSVHRYLESICLRIVRRVGDLPAIVGGLVRFLIAGWTRRLVTVTAFVGLTAAGIYMLLPPLDYLPKGNRNLVFSVMVPPPGYSVDQLFENWRSY